MVTFDKPIVQARLRLGGLAIDNTRLAGRYVDALVLLVITLVTGLFMVHTVGFALDDSYITHRYAQHLELGYGLVFNVGEHYLGTTAPGFAIVLALTHRIIDLLQIANLLAAISGKDVGHLTVLLDLPHVARYFSALSVGVIGLVCYGFITRAFPDAFGRVAGLLGAIWIMTLPQLASATGHETLPYIALVLLGLYLWRTRLALASLILGFAVIIRPDAALAFVLTAGLTGSGWLVQRRLRTLRHDIIPLLPFLLPILSWAVFAWIYYGSPIPGTLLAKRAQVALHIWPVASFGQMSSLVFNSMPAPIRWPIFLCAIAGFVIAVLRKDSFAFVGLWGFGHLIAFSTLQVTFWSWYATPLYVVYLLCSCYGMAGMVTLLWMLRRQRGALLALRIEARALSAPEVRQEPALIDAAVRLPRYAHFAAIPLSFLFLSVAMLGIAPGLQATTGPKLISQHTYSFIEVADYIHQQAPAGASLATPEPGALAYFLGPKYYVIDSLGLTGPGVSQHILAGDLEWPYLHYKPDYVLVSYEGNIQPNLPKPWFKEMYTQVAEFHHPYWTSQGGKLRLFHTQDENVAPAKIEFNDVPGGGNTPNYAQIGPGADYYARLSLPATAPRLLRLTFFDLTGRDLDIYVDDILLKSIIAGTSGGKWVTLDLPLPPEVKPILRLRFHNPGKDISAISAAELVYADAVR